jgi:hypothetical protein
MCELLPILPNLGTDEELINNPSSFFLLPSSFFLLLR